MMVKWIKAPPFSPRVRAHQGDGPLLHFYAGKPESLRSTPQALYEEIPARKIFQPHGRSKIKLGDARLGFLIA